MPYPALNLKRAHSADDAHCLKKQRLWHCGEYCITLLETRGAGKVVVSLLHDLTEREFLIISKLNGTDAGSRVTIMGQKVDAQSVIEFLEMEPSAVQGPDVPETVKLLRELIRPGLLPSVRHKSKPGSGLQLPTHHRKSGHVGVVFRIDNAMVRGGEGK